MGLSTALALGLSSQIVLMPVAMASERQALLNQYVKSEVLQKASQFIQQAQTDGYRVYDANHEAIPADDFMEKAGGDFYLVSPATSDDAGFSYRMHVSQPGDGTAVVSLVVTRPGSAEVLARRALTVDYRQDAATLSYQIKQTETILQNQLIREVGTQHASLWHRAGNALSEFFGIPSAHAAGALTVGVEVALGFAGVGVLLFVLDGVAEHEGWIHSKLVPALIGVALVGGVIFTYLSYGSESIESAPTVTVVPTPTGK